MKATHKRWTTCFNKFSWEKTLRKMRSLGIKLIYGGKPGMCCWNGFSLVATPLMMSELQEWWDKKNVEWFRKQPRGAWSVPESGEVIPWNETCISTAKTEGGIK